MKLLQPAGKCGIGQRVWSCFGVLKDLWGGGYRVFSSVGVQSSLCWDPQCGSLGWGWSGVTDHWSLATHFWHSSSTKARGWSSPDMVITVSLSKAPRRLWSTVCRVMVEVV